MYTLVIFSGEILSLILLREILSWSLMGVKGLMKFMIDLNQSNKVELQYFGDSILPCVFVVFLFLLNQFCEQQTSRSTCKDS